MKKIVKGNDFTLRIPVMKMVEGQAKAFPLPACTDVVVQVCNQFKRIPLVFEIDVKEDNVLLAKVEGDKMSLGTYAIEVKGKIFGNDWRSNEYPQFAIVSNNADADTEFGTTDEGDNSVEMDTAMVILPPTVELSDLISKANEALKTSKETNDTLNTNEEARKEAETLRGTAEQGRVSAEEARVSAEGNRTKAEEGRASAEAERVKAEKKRQSDIDAAIQDLNTHRTEFDDAEATRVNAEKSRAEAEATRKQAEADRATAEGERVKAEKTRADAEIKRKSDFDTAIKAAETATDGAEKVDATLTEGNVFEVTGRTGVKKTLDMSGLVSAQSDVARIQESMGAYSDRPDITLVAKETNKAISADGVKVTKAGWAIAEFTAEKGNIYLFKPNDVDGDVCIFAEEITNIETRGIDYTYTYNADGTIETAKATYLGATHIYTFSYAEDKSYTITDEAGETVEALPMTYETKVGSYSPLVRLNADAELPIDGYCRYMSHFKGNSSIKIVVSYKIDAADLVMKVVRDGVFASISTQLGNLSQKEDETRKKIEELHKSYVDLLFESDWNYLYVDGKNMPVIPGKKMRVYPKFRLQIGNANMKCPLVWCDMTHLDASKFTRMGYLFTNCARIESIDMSNLNVSNVTNMESMFEGCKSAVSINISGLDTSKVTNMANMFNNCFQLKEIIGLPYLVRSSCKLLPSFANDYALTTLNLSEWNTTNVGYVSLIFYGSGHIKHVIMTGDNIRLSNATSEYRMFSGLSNNCVLELGKYFFDAPKLTSFGINEFIWEKKSMVLSLVTNLFDRKAAGQPTMTITLESNSKKNLSEEQIAAITAKGYIIA